MLSLYVISLFDSKKSHVSFAVVTTTRAKAEAEACRLAGVPAEGTEPQTSQLLHRVDSVVE